MPLMAVGTALILGAGLIWVSGASVLAAYGGLFEGMCGSWRALSETCVAATPYMLAGLAVALGFRGGLFNIGAEGQFYMGALGTAVAGCPAQGTTFAHRPSQLWAWGEGSPRRSAGRSSHSSSPCSGYHAGGALQPWFTKNAEEPGGRGGVCLLAIYGSRVEKK